MVQWISFGLMGFRNNGHLSSSWSYNQGYFTSEILVNDALSWNKNKNLAPLMVICDSLSNHPPFVKMNALHSQRKTDVKIAISLLLVLLKFTPYTVMISPCHTQDDSITPMEVTLVN